jgi:hypothetical protein
LPRWNTISDRAPTPDDLKKMLRFADLREKVVVSLLALGGFRVGTLSKLQYRHVKQDLEAGKVPVHVHVEAEITKGKYGDYDTFVGKEAVEYLKDYLSLRRLGTPKMPPEGIVDSSPLIRSNRTSKVVSVSEDRLSQMVWGLYLNAGLITKGDGRRHDLCAHSLRKYFRTQLGGAGVPPDYIDYMMGHRISVYNDVKNNGFEFLQRFYDNAGLSLEPKSPASEIETLRVLIRAIRKDGKDPEALFKEALIEPHRVHIGSSDSENEQLEGLRKYLRDLIKNDLGRCI